MNDCIFCKIAVGEEGLVFKDENVVAFNDINPKAPTHILIVPKQHIGSVKDVKEESILSGMIMAARKIAEEKKLNGYKLSFNVGKEGGQVVEHLHLHLLGGWGNDKERGKFPV